MRSRVIKINCPGVNCGLILLFMVVEKFPRIRLAFEKFGAEIFNDFVKVWVLLPVGGLESRCWFDQKSVISRFGFSSWLGHTQECPCMSEAVDQVIDLHQFCFYLIIGAGLDTFGHSCSVEIKNSKIFARVLNPLI